MAVFRLSNSYGQGFDMNHNPDKTWDFHDRGLGYYGNGGWFLIGEPLVAKLTYTFGPTSSAHNPILATQDYFNHNGDNILSITDINLRQTVSAWQFPNMWLDKMTDQADEFFGNDYNDYIRAGLGNDIIHGGLGNDTHDGGAGNDYYYGGEGNDTFLVNDVLDDVREFEDEGTADRVFTTLNSYSLDAEVERLYFRGDGEFNGRGNLLNNYIYGGTNDDILKGGSGNDRVVGGAGDDSIYGQRGADSLTGGEGFDSFIFDYAPRSTEVDKITDFNLLEDQIVFNNAAFTKIGLDGALKSSAFWSSNAGIAHDSNDRIIYDRDGGQLWYDMDGNGRGAAVQVAQLSAGLNGLGSTEFYIV